MPRRHGAPRCKRLYQIMSHRSALTATPRHGPECEPRPHHGRVSPVGRAGGRRAVSFPKQSARTVSICRNRLVEFSAICSPLENGLTRRANHRHNANIAKIAKPARRNPSRAFCLKFPNRTAAAHRRRNSQRPAGRRERAVVRAFHHTIGRHARTCRLAAWIVTAARGP